MNEFKGLVEEQKGKSVYILIDGGFKLAKIGDVVGDCVKVNLDKALDGISVVYFNVDNLVLAGS